MWQREKGHYEPKAARNKALSSMGCSLEFEVTSWYKRTTRAEFSIVSTNRPLLLENADTGIFYTRVVALESVRTILNDGGNE